MFMAMTVMRHRSRRSIRAPLPTITALLALVAAIPLSLGGTASGFRLVPATILLLAGLLFSLVSATALGRCFGLLPAARGVVTGGTYRLVRHPLYLGELTTMLGVALGAQRVLLTVPAWLFVALIQAIRAHYEERTLAEAFPHYRAYVAEVPYRIVPGLY